MTAARIPSATSTSCAVFALLLVLVTVRGLQRSRNVRDLIATRENERNAQAFRLSPTRVRLLAFALSGFFASFAGGVLVLHQQALGKDIFAPVESIRALTMVVVGGLGSVPGAILGAVFLKSTEWFAGVVPQRFRFLFQFAGSGIGLIVVLWLLPGGLGSVLYRVRDMWLRRVARRRNLVVPSLIADIGDDPELLTGQGQARGRGGDERRQAQAARPEVPGTASRQRPVPDVDYFTYPDLALSGGKPNLLSLRSVDVAYGQVQVLFGVSLELRRRRDDRAARHERRRQVDRAARDLGPGRARTRQHQPRGHRHQRHGPAHDRPEGRDPGARRAGRLPVADRRREPQGRAVDAPARPRVREDGHRGGARPLPGAAEPHERPGRAALGWSAADARARDGVPRQARRPHDRRAVARSRAARGRAAPRGRAPVPRAGRHRDPRRAVGERRAHHRRQGVLHGEGGHPFPRPHRRAARTPRPAAFHLPRRCGGGRRRRSRGSQEGRAARRDRQPRPRAGARERRRTPRGPRDPGHHAPLLRDHRGRRRVDQAPRGRDRRHRRAQRRGQDHAVRPHLGVPPPRLRLGHRRGRRRDASSARRVAPSSGSPVRSRTPASSGHSPCTRRSASRSTGPSRCGTRSPRCSTSRTSCSPSGASESGPTSSSR